MNDWITALIAFFAAFVLANIVDANGIERICSDEWVTKCEKRK